MNSTTNETCSSRADDPGTRGGLSSVVGSVGRRRVLLGLLASGTGAALAPVLTASESAGPAHAGFEETYRRRLIVGVRDRVGRSAHQGSGGWRVTVDGRPLHLMRRADGSWMTMVDHYQSYPTPLAAARAAVDELGPTERLSMPDDSAGHMTGSGTPSRPTGVEGDHHSGVHA
ncbi:tyrosinase family oxidase copper chaperone [Streptomyces cellulosae]|uniref:Tyrosinase family oxidase copper chaperone n=1 Tax=Streptomyces cellulosae TaxID=1968 RepID=A0ABW7Y700_STRCE